MDSDGLNSLKYTVENLTEHRLYTLVTVDVKQAMLQDQAESFLQDHSTSRFFYDMNQIVTWQINMINCSLFIENILVNLLLLKTITSDTPAVLLARAKYSYFLWLILGWKYILNYSTWLLRFSWLWRRWCNFGASQQALNPDITHITSFFKGN